MVKKIIFICIIVVGIFLRVYAVEQVPGGLFGDEVSLAINTKTIAQNGTDEYGNKYPFGFESFSDYKMPGYIYASVIPYDIFGSRILSIRFISILASIIALFLIGYFAKIIFPKRKNLPLLAMAILALSPYHIHFGRIAYETNFATMLLLGFFIVFFKFISEQKLRWLFLGIFLLLGSCWTYPAPQLIIPLFLILFGIFAYVAKPRDISLRYALYAIFIYLGVALCSFIPAILNPAMDKRTLGYVVGSGDTSLFHIFLQKGLSTVSSWLRSFNLEFLFDKGDIFAYRSGTKMAGIFLPITLIGFIVGGMGYVKEFSSKEFSYVTLLILLIVCGLPSALTWSVPYGPRFLPMIIPLTILIALGADYLLSWLGKQKKIVRIFLFILFGVIVIYQTIWFANIYLIHFPILSEPEFVSATQELGAYLKDVRKTNPQSTTYFLEGKSCASWRYDDLHFWYYADLPNQDMITWDKEFRDMRLKSGNPFDAYDFLAHPTARFDHVVLYPTIEEMTKAPTGSILVHCGIVIKDISPQTEKLIKTFYLYENKKENPEYIVTIKK